MFSQRLFLSVIFFVLLSGLSRARCDERPAYPPASTNEASLLKLCAPFLEMSDSELIALAPPQGGFYFSNCPNCDQGDQDNQITWNLELGDKVQCKYCKAILPSEKYPENEQLVATTPTGKTQVFKFYRAPDGMGYWFEGRRWYEQRMLVQDAAYNLAQLYTLDPVKHAGAGHRAALILNRFAQLFPDYIARFDYPGVDKEFLDADKVTQGYKKKPDGAYRFARWDWWAYMDVSRQLLLTYDLLRDTKLLTPDNKSKIETQLFGAMLDFVALYDESPLTNMHPTLWTAEVVASRVLNRPALAEKVIVQMKRLLHDEFTYDGMWAEGTPSYHEQTVIGLKIVLASLRPNLKGAAFDEWLAKEQPDLWRALRAADALRLPNDRYAAVHDSWAEQRYYGQPTSQSTPRLLPGMGYGILGGGANQKQWQAHLNWSGRFGHDHYDSLNILLYGAGREQVSDIGYSHTKARAWTMTTAAHNTVLIDTLNQMTSNGTDSALGSLQIFNAADPDFQIVQASAGAYPNVATKYQRTLIAVGEVGSTPDASEPYVVDVFDVAGGSRHDWLLHGSADEPQDLELQTKVGKQEKSLPLQPLASLLPADFKFEPLTMTGNYERITNGPWALGNFRDLETGTSDQTIIATFRNKAEPTRGLRSWILNAPKTTLTTARSWAVRGTGTSFAENESALDEHLRATLMVRRDEAQSRFIAVHQPFASAGSTPNVGQVQTVTQIPLLPDGFALKIERASGTDYLLFGEADGKPRSGNDGALQFSFDGRVALAQAKAGGQGAGREYSLKMLDGTRFQFGSEKLNGKKLQPARLLRVEENRLTIEGRFPVAVGGVLLVRHGDKRTTAFHVARVENEGANTVIETVEPPVLTGEVNGVLKMLSFPRLELPAPHSIEASVLTVKP